MADPIVEELALELDQALADINRIDDALQQVASGFKVALADAVGVLSESVQVPEIEVGEIDASSVGAAIDAEILDAAGTPVVLDADAAAVAVAVDEAVAPQTVEIDADIAAAQDAIASLASDPIAIEVDITGAGPEGLSEELDRTGASADSARGELLGMASASTIAGTAAGVTKGELGGLAGTAGLMGGNAAAAATGIAAIGGAAVVMAKDALEAEAATLRFQQTFGLLAADVDHIDVGSLHEDLSALALSLGSDDDALRNVASSFALFQQNAGTSAEAAATASQQLVGLAARAVALNPALGSVEDVADRLGRALARGGRFASEFQISLSPVEIRTRAAENAARGLGDGVSFAALELAGAQLAAEKYGASLDKDIAKGVANPIVQLRSLTQGFREATEEIGKPLISPVLDLVRESIPLGVDVAKVVASLAQAGLPALEGFVEVLGGMLRILEPVIGLLDAIPEPVFAAAGAFIAVRLAIGGVVAAFGEMSAVGTIALGPLGLVAAAVAAVVIGIQAFGSKSEEATPITAALAEQLTKVRDAADGSGKKVIDLTENVEELLKSGGDNALTDLFGPFQGEANEILASLRLVGFGIDDVSAALAAGEAGADRVGAAFKRVFGSDVGETLTADFVKAQGQFEQSAKQSLLVNSELTDSESDRLDVLNENADATSGYAALLADVNIRLGNTAEATDKATEATEQFGSIQGALVTTNREANDSWVALALGIANGTIGVEDYARAAALLNVNDVGAFADAVKQSVQSFVDVATGQLPLVTAAFADLNNDSKVTATEIEANFRKIITDSLQFGAVINRLADEGFVNLAAAVAQQGPAAAAAVADLFKNAPEKIPQLEALAKGARASVDAASDAVTEVAPEIISKTGILADDMESAFQVDFASTTLEGLEAAFALFDKVDVPPGVKNVGHEIGAALAEGLKEGATGGEDAGAGMIDDVEKGARRAGEIFSPSRLFERLGRDIVAGFATGLSADDQLAGAGRTMIESLQSDLSGFAAQSLGVPAALDPRVSAQAVESAAPAQLPSRGVTVEGPLIGTVHNEQTAFQVAAELAWTYSP